MPTGSNCDTERVEKAFVNQLIEPQNDTVTQTHLPIRPLFKRVICYFKSLWQLKNN